MTNRTNKGPSRWWYLVAVGVGLAASALMVLLLFSQLNSLEKSLTQLVVPGDVELSLAEPGTYTIFLEEKSSIDGRIYNSSGDSISDLQVTVYSGTGQSLQLRGPSISSNYELQGRSGTAVLEFDVNEPGQYRLTGTYSDARTKPEVVLAVGAGHMGMLLTGVVGGLAVMFGGIAVAIAIIVTVFIRRRRARAALLSTA
jgi:hypothetical protein